MRINKLLILTVLLFVIVNTTYFHEEYTGFFGFLFFSFLFIIILLFQVKNLIQIIKSGLKEKSKVLNFIIITILLTIIFYKPTGIVNFENYESQDLYIATREGAANCNMTLKLKQNKSYRLKSVCFDVLKVEGKYKEINDTIWFNPSIKVHPDRDFKFGIIKMKSKYGSKGSIFLYRNRYDKLPMELWTQLNILK